MPLNQPTPWWTLPEYAGGYQDSVRNAPAGKYFDPTNGGAYRNIVGSPTDLLAERTRQHQMEDQRFAQQTSLDQQRQQQEGENFRTNQRVTNQQIDANSQAAADRARRQMQVDDLLKNLTTATGGQLPPGGGGGAPPPQVSGPSAPNYQTLDASSAAQNAEFGKLKAKSGQLGRSALQSLRSELSGRGILGSGGEGRGLADIVAGATNPLSDLDTAALHENVGIGEHNADLAQQSNLAGYTGSITQRGQDIAHQDSQNALAQSANRDRNQMILDILRTMRGGR